MRKLTGTQPGTNGITTVIDSNWKLNFIINPQPYLYGQPKDVYVFHAMGLFQDEVGNFIKKPMAQCTGREILEEMLRHLKFDADLERILDSSIVRPVQQPFGISQFLVRKVDSRPDVIPRGSTNLGLKWSVCRNSARLRLYDGVFGARRADGGLPTAESR